MTKILITGGAGFIGSHLCEGLIVRGYQVRVLDNLSYGRREWAPPAAEFLEGDIRDPDACRRAAAGVHGVFHMAAMSRSGHRKIRSSFAPPAISSAPRTCCWRRAMPA